METIKVEGYNRGQNLPWLEQLWLAPITELLPKRADAPPGTSILSSARVIHLTFPPAAAYLDIVPENPTAHAVKVTIQQPGFAKTIQDFLQKYNAMEFQVLTLDRNGLLWELGDADRGLKIMYQYTNNSRAITGVDLSGKIGTYKVVDESSSVPFLSNREFSQEFSIEFL